MAITIHSSIVNGPQPQKADGFGAGSSVVNAPTAIVPGDPLLTEGSDNITTEAGDHLLTN